MVFGIIVQRNQAISYLKELLGSDIGVSPESVSIERKRDSEAVEVHIKITNSKRESIKEIARKRELTVKEDGDSIIIYGS